MSAQARYLPDGRRLHLNHGPIDLVIEAEGRDRVKAMHAAQARFEGLLPGLVRDLPKLRRALDGNPFADPVSNRMAVAVAPYDTEFVTPKAAVAGAVADEVLAAMMRNARLTKAYVNNGGDIAFHLDTGSELCVASASGPLLIKDTDRPRGLATSGWRGRSFSLGIADAVTVAASTAAAADVAATLIANAVDLPGNPAIIRCPANTIEPDTDLTDQLVTQDVGPLSSFDRQTALNRGIAFAKSCMEADLIHAATLTLQGDTQIVTFETKDLTYA